jgi:hypothetical protein
MTEIPQVYSAIAAVTRSLSKKGIAKNRTNRDSGYAFRGIDDIYAALSPLFARHRLCLLPRVLEQERQSHRTEKGDLLFTTCVRVAFDIVSVADGSQHTISTFGEAADAGDKGMPKALSAAFKYAVIQAFCIPIGSEDADAYTPPVLAGDGLPPVQGWCAWSEDIRQMVCSCVSHEALDRLQATYRDQLRSLARTEPSLYEEIGIVIGEQRAGIRVPRLEVV